MSDTHLNGAKSNGTSATEVKTPFLIGVAGGTASGKVNLEKMCSSHQSSHTAISLYIFVKDIIALYAQGKNVNF